MCAIANAISNKGIADRVSAIFLQHGFSSPVTVDAIGTFCAENPHLQNQMMETLNSTEFHVTGNEEEATTLKIPAVVFGMPTYVFGLMILNLILIVFLARKK